MYDVVFCVVDWCDYWIFWGKVCFFGDDEIVRKEWNLEFF